MQKVKELLSGDKHQDSTTASHDGSLNSANTSSSTGINNSSNGQSTGQLNATGDRVGRAEETLGQSNRSATGKGTNDFADPHTLGHDHSAASKFDPSAETTTHDHKHLGAVTHQQKHHHEVEEVERQKEHERHVHHVQHHVQPVHDVQQSEETHHSKVHPVTQVKETHGSTEKDHAEFASLANKHHNTTTEGAHTKTIIDKGERVHETVQHHVHHVTQPVIEQEVHDNHRTHTVIPTHHVTHEAPIVHKSAVHEPVSMSDFVNGGGKLNSGLSHDNAGVLNQAGCERTVDGPGESLAQDLGLTKGTTAGQHASGNTRI